MVGFAEIDLVVSRHVGAGFALDDAGGEVTAAGTDELFKVGFLVPVAEGLDAGGDVVVLWMAGFDELLLLAWTVKSQGWMGLRILEWRGVLL